MLGRRVLASLACALTLALGACAASSNTSQTGAFQLVSNAASKTEAAKTAHMAMSMSLSGATARAITMTGTGQIDLTNRAAELSFDMAGIPGRVGTVLFDMVVKDGAFYMHLPTSLAGPMQGGKSWIRVDLAALSGQSGVGFGGLSGGSMTAFDPAQTLAYLKGASRSVTHVGTETVHGVQAQRYHIVIDPKKALQKASGSLQCGLGAAERVLGNLTIPADVWIDEQGRLRRMEMHFTISPPGTTKSVGMTLRMDLFDFGTPVHITAPPASQVYNATPGLRGQLEANCGAQQS